MWGDDPFSENMLRVAREVRRDGILVQDPAVDVFVGGERWVPAGIEVAGTGIALCAAPNNDFSEAVPLDPACRVWGGFPLLPRSQAELARLCDEWARGLRWQGWLENAKRLE